MLLLGLAIGLLTATTALPVADLSPSPRPETAIRVVSASHEIDFPERVLFHLEAESDVPITEVTLYYRLGRRDVRIYGYPRFTPSTRVSADFAIRTAGANFIPSGVDIEYYYVVQDANGDAFESDRYFLEYKDPAFGWHRYEQGDLIFLWHDRPESRVVEVAKDVDQRLRPVRELLGLHDPEPMKAVLVNSPAEAGRSFPLISGETTRNHVYGGFAFGDLDVLVLLGLNTDGIVHEMTHLLIDDALDSPFARVPDWLNEGLAMYFESSSAGSNRTLTQAARDGRLKPLRSMGNVPGRPQDVRLFYAQSRSIVRHVMDAHGQERMATLLASLNDGNRIEEAIEATYGMTLEQLEGEWEAQFRGETSGSPTADAGTIGTSAIIAGAVAVTATALVVRWLRRIVTSRSP